MKMAAFVVSNGLLTQVQNANRRRRRVTGFRCVASLSAKGVFADVGSGVISVSGADRIRFLHNMSTNNLAALKSGDVRLSTMTNSIGRAIELLAVLMDEESCILIVSKDKVEDIISTFDKCVHCPVLTADGCPLRAGRRERPLTADEFAVAGTFSRETRLQLRTKLPSDP